VRLARIAWIAGLAGLVAVAACHHGAVPPDAPTCAATAEHVRGLLAPDARATRIRGVVATRCVADAWTPEVRGCMLATTSLRHPRHCKAMLTAAQRAALERGLAAAALPPERSPQTCTEYRGLIDKLAACPAIPAAARGALEQAYRELAQAWARGIYDTPTIEAECRSMTDGLRRAMAATCGW
jgi:hypothetical protein